MTLHSLLSWVRTHDCAQDAHIIDGAIYATAHSYDRNGNHFANLERIGATLRECRDWLGY
jgi:hypothetical protein